MAGAGAGDVDYLPLDIISRILSWLPIPSLLRLKSVSKSWLSLIETPHFVYKHIRFTNNTDLIILTRPYPHGYTTPHQQISLLRGATKSELLLDFPVTDDPYQVNSVEIVASCNGIVCLQQDRRVCLWNPATKHYTNLPLLPVFTYKCSTGFGFDAKTNDYKLVAINSVVHGDYVAHIYSLGSDSWKKFEGFEPPGYLSLGIKASYRDQIYCWLDLTVPTGGRSFYTFDFSHEVFGNIPSPTSIEPSNLFIVMDNIACIGKVIDQVDGGIIENACYEIWMLSDYQVKESWTKLYSIDPVFDEATRWMTWFSNNGDFLLFREGERLFLYDLVTRGVVNLPVHARSNGFDAVIYRESMLSIKRGNGAANRVTSKFPKSYKVSLTPQ